MKTSIHFYIKEGKQDISIATLYDYPNNYQFNKGDTFWFSVDEMYPRTISNLKKQWPDDFVLAMIKSNKEKREKLGLEKYKISSVYRSLEENPNKNTSEDCSYELTIEYTCKIVKRIYWKFWQNYKFKQFFKNIFNK